ncbi:MAG: CDP-alcohol phosphatidyltransferase family protein [Rhodospirillales bacterium]
MQTSPHSGGSGGPGSGPLLHIDARPKTLGNVDPGGFILGLSVLARLVKTAKKNGFATIQVAGDSSLEPLLAGTDATLTPPDTFPSAGAAVVPATYLGEKAWLADLAARPGDATQMTFPVPPLDLAVDPDIKKAEQRLLSTLIKDTDGFMSRHFARPISLRLSRILAPRGVTPNQMTVVSTAIGLSAAPFFLSSSPLMQTLGSALFILHSIVDGCDGELARLTFRESRIGGLLDFWGDNLVHVAVFAAMGLGWAMAADAVWPLYLTGLAVAGTAGSAAAVYWFTLRRKDTGGPVYTSVSSGTPDRLSKHLDALSRRDFIYLVFVLALFGKAAWFLALTAVGAPVFLILVLILAARTRPDERSA